MKVAIVSTGLGNVKRGFEIFADELYSHLKTEIDVTLFKGGGERKEKEVVLPNISRNSLLLGGKNSSLSYWTRCKIEQTTFSVFLLYPLIRGGFDVIHVMDPSVYAVLYKLKKRFNIFPAMVVTNGGPFTLNRVSKFEFVHQVTPYYYDKAKRAGVNEEKMDVIPYPVDTSLFKPGADSDFRMRHGISEDCYLIISVGAVNKSHKRMDWIIKEAARLKERPYLLIVGEEDGETPDIKKLGIEKLPGRLKFITLDRGELAEAYCAADLFILASTIEGFGIVFIEAMASGLPIITHDHPNQRWILGEVGTFVDMEKEGELAKKIALFMADKEAGVKLGEKGRVRAETVFSWDALTEKYVGLYEKVVNHRV